MKTLVDTNVLLDIITQEKGWSAWAEAARYRTYFPGLTIIAP